MATYSIYATVTGGKYIGELEAESVEDAIEKSYDVFADELSISLCWHCSSQCESAEVSEVLAYVSEE